MGQKKVNKKSTTISSSEPSFNDDDNKKEVKLDKAIEGTISWLEKDKNDPFREWKDRLHQFTKSFDNDMEGPYDVVFIFAGGNDAKSAFIPFYVKTAKGEEEFSLTEKDDGRDSSLFGDLQRIMDHLGPKMNTNFTP